MRIVNEGADQEDFDELKVIMEVFQVGKRMKELAREGQKIQHNNYSKDFE